jgi:hypothetical protein
VFHNYDERVFQLHIQRGWTQERTAAEIGVSVSKIKLAVKRIYQQFSHHDPEVLRRERAKVIARSDHIYGEAIGEWDKSKDRKETKERGRQESFPDTAEGEGSSKPGKMKTSADYGAHGSKQARRPALPDSGSKCQRTASRNPWARRR